MHQYVFYVAYAINAILLVLPTASSVFKREPTTDLPKFPNISLPDADGKLHLTQGEFTALCDWVVALRKLWVAEHCGWKWCEIVDMVRIIVQFAVSFVLFWWYMEYMEWTGVFIKYWRSPSVPTPTGSQVCPEQVEQSPLRPHPR